MDRTLFVFHNLSPTEAMGQKKGTGDMEIGSQHESRKQFPCEEKTQ
jgi:hypothetical protein